jgi:hypothetical protein
MFWLSLTLVAAAEDSAAAWTPSAAFAPAAHALSARDGNFDCSTIEAMTPDPVGLLRELVDHAVRPPWIAMRAADCLVTRHAEAAAADLDAWVADPERLGLGLLVMSRLDRLPEERATFLAARALEQGPDPVAVRRRLDGSAHPAVRALVTP